MACAASTIGKEHRFGHPATSDNFYTCPPYLLHTNQPVIYIASVVNTGLKNSFLFLFVCFTSQLKAQSTNCVLKPPQINIHFGSGDVYDINTGRYSNYERVQHYCPDDGHYSYTDYTSDCFGAWHTVTEDHTPGDISGNMLLVNSSYNPGSFFSTRLNGLKSGSVYQFALWLMNVYKISNWCSSPLLPNITIRLQTETGKTLAQFGTGEIIQSDEPRWTQYRALFTMPPSETSLTLTMINNKPGGCGNDFALDDITLRECVPPTPVVKATTKTTVVTKKQTTVIKTPPKKTITEPVKSEPPIIQIEKPEKDSQSSSTAVLKKKLQALPPPPPALITRTNLLVKQIETEAGEIRIDLYDNGEIDGDTISIYHNNVLLIAHARLTQKATTMNISVDVAHPHHELIMVAENLGSIPPNTSLMIITAGTKRYQVFISSNEQKNAKVIFDLKE
jgi:hypothetical protein